MVFALNYRSSTENKFCTCTPTKLVCGFKQIPRFPSITDSEYMHAVLLQALMSSPFKIILQHINVLTYSKPGKLNERCIHQL